MLGHFCFRGLTNPEIVGQLRAVGTSAIPRCRRFQPSTGLVARLRSRRVAGKCLILFQHLTGGSPFLFCVPSGRPTGRVVKDPQQLPKICFNRREAAHVLGVDPRVLVESNAPRMKLGRRILFPVDELTAWVRQQTKDGPFGSKNGTKG